MERSKYSVVQFIVMLILSISALNVQAQPNYKKMIYEAYIHGEIDQWARIIRSIETNNFPVTIDQKLELVNYYYGYLGYLVGRKKYSQAQLIIVKGEKLINQVLVSSPQNATAFAYKGSYIGFRIGINRMKVMSLGPESANNINKAFELDSQNLQAIIDKANMLYHAPRYFGGNKDEALKLFLKGAKLMETDKNTENNWFYLNVLILIAKAYELMEQPLHAKFTYEKILRNEPNFTWVRDELYPKLLTKMKS